MSAPGWGCGGCRQDNPAGTRFCGHCGRPAASGEPEPGEPSSGEPATAAASVEDVLRSFVSGPVADRLVEAGGRLTEERRLVTALFADLSGFTALAGRLDPEQLLEVIDPVIRGLTDIVGAHGGYVEKFAGDALLAFFGAPVAHEDDAERALRVALEMHARLPGLCTAPSATELSLHIGVNSGHVVARVVGSEVRLDYAVLGDAVVLAQRLESLAPSGQTYVGATTHRLASGRFELGPLGPLTVKGRTEQVAAWRLLAERPARATGSVTPLLGRGAELARARRALAPLQDGSDAVLAVLGEAGVGKSRLLQELRRGAAADGTAWSEGRCLSSVASTPYRPYAELLRSQLGVAFDAPPVEVAQRLRAVLSELGLDRELPYLARLLGLPAQPGDQDDLEPQALRRALDGAVVAWARALAGGGPVFLTIEDLHWADPSSLTLTRELARRCGDVPLAIVLTGRPESASAVADLTGDLPAERSCVLRLGSLDPAAVGSLVADVLDGAAAPELVAMVHERSGGNPLFAQEMVRSLRDAGELTGGPGRWATVPGFDAAHVPPTVEGLLSSRMDLLPRAAVRVLQTAAVIGRRVPLRMLLEILGADAGSGPEGAEPQLALLLERGLLEAADEGLLHFPHVLVLDVAYSRLLRRQQRELHARVAEVAERLYGAGDEAVDLLARHLYLARAGGRAVDYLLRAGLRAVRLYANAEATTHLERAVELVRELPEQEHRLPALLLELAQVHEVVGRYDDALRLYEEVRDRFGDLRAWRGAAAVLRRQGHYPAALALLDEGVAVPGAGAEDVAALELERGRTELFEGRLADAGRSLRRGLAGAPAGGPVAAHLLLTLTRAEMSAGDPATALEFGVLALEQLRARQDTRGLAAGLRIVGSVYEALGRFDEAAAALRPGLELARRVGDVEEIGGCLLNLGMVEMGRGRPEAAVESSRLALGEFERVGHQLGTAAAAANLAEWLVLSGRYDEAQDHCDQALALAGRLGDRLTLADAMLTRARLRLGQGRPQEAAVDADQAAADFAAVGAQPFAERSRELAAQARAAATG